jgi:6-pyruvoyltetrahydropterin/6-carboxytetrahydropterin synthase
MQIKISRKEHFSASHSLQIPSKSPVENSSIFGKCSQLHGHNYTLIITLKGKVGADGMVFNLTLLKQIVQREVLDLLDHSNLVSLVVCPFVAVLPSCWRGLACWVGSC